VWFQPRRKAVLSLQEPSPDGETALLPLAGDLWGRLQALASARGQPPEELARALLVRGLKQEARRAQAEAALSALTPREQEVAWLTTRGYTNRQIADSLVVSPETVKTHVAHVLEKFDVRSKAELRVRLMDLGVRWWQTGAG
jgi:DNA-binding NarL/FixJ family response regulator